MSFNVKYKFEKYKIPEKGKYIYLLCSGSNCEFKHAFGNCIYILELAYYFHITTFWRQTTKILSI